MAGKKLVVAASLLAVLVILAFSIGIATSGDEGLIGSLTQLQEDDVVFFSDHRVYLVYNDGEPLALWDDAQHVGDRVIFCHSSQLFESLAHGEKFDSRGYYLAGPAARGLARYPVTVDGDRVIVDLQNRQPGPPREPRLAKEPSGPFCDHG